MSVALSCLLLFSALLSGCGVLGGSSAACGQVVPSLEPSRAVPGETFVLSGGGFGRVCRDTGPSLRFGRPQQDIRIEMRQGEKTWSLATVDAGPDYTVEATLKVPKDAEPGRATVVVNRAEPLVPMKIPFRVLGGEPR